MTLRRWIEYRPRPRPGVSLADLDTPARKAAFRLLATALSAPAYAQALTIVALEEVLDRAEGWSRGRHSNDYWVIALVIGLAAALIVAFLLLMLIRSVASIEKSVGGLLETATAVAGNTANIPQLQATAPVLARIVDEAVVQDGYMNALTDGFGGGNGH